MLSRININNIGKLFVSIIGIIGHSFLLLFIILFHYIPQKYKIFAVVFDKKINSLKNILFIFGQIGMILTYAFDYVYRSVISPIIIYMLNIFSFLILAIFYLYKAMYCHDCNKYIKFGIILVGLLYLLFMFDKIYQLSIEYQIDDKLKNNKNIKNKFKYMVKNFKNIKNNSNNSNNNNSNSNNSNHCNSNNFTNSNNSNNIS